jgi:hypothetical protein
VTLRPFTDFVIRNMFRPDAARVLVEQVEQVALRGAPESDNAEAGTEAGSACAAAPLPTPEEVRAMVARAMAEAAVRMADRAANSDASEASDDECC